MAGPKRVSLAVPAHKVTAAKIVVALLNECDPDAAKIDVQETDNGETTVDGVSNSDSEAARTLSKLSDKAHILLAPASWTLLKFPSSPKDRAMMGLLGQLNKQLQFRTYLEGHKLSLSDLEQFVSLGTTLNFDTDIFPGKNSFPHAHRWLCYMASQSFIAPLLINAQEPKTQAAEDVEAATQATSQNALSDIEKLAQMESTFASKLTGAEMNAVVTRFPPEPSGYLHIGHAKAALINAFYARYFHGRLLIRFDDTNPNKEKAEFEESIKNDLGILGVKGEGPSYTSDYLPQLEEACEKLIQLGLGYVDDTPTELMREQRFDGVESKSRNLSVEESLRRWREMQAGSAEGLAMCVRGKIDMQNPNKCMRDPVFYRTNVEIPHHRTGTKFKVYPTYDFACPLVDSWSGVTHALRTNEYADRIPQYYWVQDALGVRRTIIYEFSRLNFTNTVLSKRKLGWLVETGVVEGWDDPRFPTVRGLQRRGLQIQALHEFLIEQGPSKNSNLMEWDKLWSKNAKVIDPQAPRYMAVASDCVALSLQDLTGTDGVTRPRALHPKNPSLGEVEMCISPIVFVEREDIRECVNGEEITLMRYGNVILDTIDRDASGEVLSVKGHSHLEGDVKKTRKKMHWIPGMNQFRFVLREYDHIITKRKPEEGDSMEDIVNRNSCHDTDCVGEPLMSNLQEGDILQLERRGFCRVDRSTPEGVRIFIKIPDGKMKAMSTLSTRVDAASLVKGSSAQQ
eukprot:Gregarina_sp_Poly_1__512@NODE_1123_length_5018_cov_98_055948_g777_i0_p1_GENE_NODE_1123_length_5018_cov_98_055948_g777_i0NODE_1123_length_5018_cov_98_055948_g777_i0_p1_ORF_typecomplete_len738_score103_82tRNAsynt_1c/PF00749_21/2_1e80tRNAsynt_1c_C/PF03950_18/1_1e34GST_C/PF00043_25/0_00066tRNAsynt_1/PF00133_22/0_11_NODE_1123_length_5018_cov_98_055948_g777_i027634976